ncbi:MAG: esterase family protein [Actinomycetota bacterium]|nr:esterase family protein [Actinomycetota bacterium]
MMTVMADVTRRAALRLGVGAAGAAGLFGVGVGRSPAASRATGNAYPTRESGSFVSAARGGVETNWIIARPPGQTAPLRPVIALHCKDEDAAWVMDLGVEEELAKLTASGRSPFAVVAVDGGNSYWRPHGSGEDPGAMVLGELIPMLADKGIDTSRVGFMGWSMGGYGAMLLATRLGPARTAGICAISPAIYMTYFGAPAGAFDSVDDWRTNSAFGLVPQLAHIPLRVDCGTSDSFYYATRSFVGQLNPPPAGGFSPGGHDVSYWRAQLPAQLAWLGS